MWMLLVLWVLSPLGLIPAVLVLTLRCRDLKQENERLRRRKPASPAPPPVQPELPGFRPLSEEEALAFAEETAEPPGRPSTAADRYPAPAASAAGNRQTANDYLAGRPPAAEKGTAQPAAPSRREPGRERHSSMQPLQLVLATGVAFVLLSGVIFATTAWRRLGAGPRTFLVFLAVALFYGISAICERQFRLRATGRAFFALGTLFIPTALLAAGHFAVFGQWLSLYGPGRPLLGMLAMLLTGAACVCGARRYLSRFYLAGVYGCISAEVLYLIRLFHPPADIQALLLALWCAALAALALRPPPFFQESVLLHRQHLWLFFALNLFLFAPFSLFTPSANPLTALPLAGFSALFLLGGSRREESGWQTAGTVLFTLFFLTASLRLAGGWTEASAVLALSLAAALFLLLGGLRLFPETMRRGLEIAFGVTACGVLLWNGLNAWQWEGWTAPAVLSLLTLAAAATAAAIRQGGGYALIQPVFLLALCIGFTGWLPFRYAVSLACRSVLSAAAALAVRAAASARWGKPLRTLVSDLLYPFCCLFCGLRLSLLPGREASLAGLFSMLLFHLLLLLLAIEKNGGRLQPPARLLLPHLPFTLLPFLFRLFPSLPGWTFCNLFFAGLCILAAALQLSKEERFRSLLPSLLLAILIDTPLLPIVFWYTGTGGSALCLWLAAAFWSLRLCIQLTGGETPLSFPLPECTLLLAVYATASAWFPQSFFTFRLLATAAAAAALFILTEASGRSVPGSALAARLQRSFLAALLALACLSVFSCLTENGLPFFSTLFGAAAVFTAFAALRWKRTAEPWEAVPLFFLYPLLWRGLVLASVTHGLRCLANAILFLLCAAAGRILWRGKFSFGSERLRADWLLLANLCAPAFLLFYGGRYALFGAALLLALWFLLLLGKGESQAWNRWALTGMGLCLCLAFWGQPFWRLPDWLALKWNLLPLLLFPAACRYGIWREKGRAIGLMQYAAACFSVLCLFCEAAWREQIGDALLLGGLLVLLLFFSFLVRRRRWLLLSVFALLAQAFYLTRSFWLRLSWWSYLLIVGTVLISYAAACEIGRQKGKDLPGLLNRRFQDWQW